MKEIIIRTDDTDDGLYQEIVALASRYKDKIEIVSYPSTPIISFRGLTINCEQKEVFRDKSKIWLTPHEYDLLYLLASRAGKAISKEEIFNVVWGKNSESIIKAVANTISNLREKIEPDRQHPLYIQTVLGGYMFAPYI